MKYDVLYQEWVDAQNEKDYSLADSIRDQFERLHAITPFAVGEKLVEGKTFHRMPESVWQKKYGNHGVGEHLERLDSRSGVKMKSLGYKYVL
jgi:hypothetical protein